MGYVDYSIESGVSVTLRLGHNRRISNPLLSSFCNNKDFKESVKANLFFKYDSTSPTIAINSSKTCSNGLCGYLAYYQFIRSNQNNESFQCPNLKDKTELRAFIEFYQRIDMANFQQPQLEAKQKKHLSLMHNLERWCNGTHDDEYKTSNAVISKDDWCSDSLLAEYDKYHLRKGEIRIHASCIDGSGLFQIFVSRGTFGTQDSRIKARDFELLSQVPYMTMYHNLHFFLMPNPLFGKETNNIYASFINRLRNLMLFYQKYSNTS